MPNTPALYHSDAAPQIKVLLLENVDPLAVRLFENQGYDVETISRALTVEELKSKIKGVHILGIRSKTQVTKEVLDEANDLLAIGCYCIGTDQVDCRAATLKGTIVFNSPFSNSRSVAELVLCEIIALSRQLGDRNMESHAKKWSKTSKGCREIRGKTLGIIGYGHIGSQLSVLAESIGMLVIYYDIHSIMPHGLARSADSLGDLLAGSDFVSLHVPDTEETRGMLGAKQFFQMKKGSFVLNASRGKVVDLVALKSALDSGHLAGAALDVYPVEPESNGPIDYDIFNGLESCKNVILTPHIGGSTEEAQRTIGQEVASAILKFMLTGATMGAVSFPEVDPRLSLNERQCRIINVHKNVPGVLKKMNKIVSHYNIAKQSSEAKGEVAYLIVDIDDIDSFEAALAIIQNIDANVAESISTRFLYQKGKVTQNGLTRL